MATKRVAVLDVGSNSVRLLVADCSAGQVFSVYTDKITSRLLAGFHDGRLSEASIKRTSQAIKALAESARALGATEILGFGTSAMRDGQNRDLLIEYAARLGVALKVMSGEAEAALAYAGAAPEGRCGVLDIGGGSTEMLVGENRMVHASSSAQMGAVRLFGAIPDPHAPMLIQAARAALTPSWQAVTHWPVDAWIGVGGTATTLVAMCLKLTHYDPARIEGHPLTYPVVLKWLHTLCAMPKHERREIAGLSPERADIIPHGAAILCAFFELSGAAQLTVTDRDNLMGYIQMVLSRPQSNG